MTGLLPRAGWIVGFPARGLLLAFIALYRATAGLVLGGRCRFYPSCSAYAEQAIRELGAVRGVALSLWRLLRCSPLTPGGIDRPPRRAAECDDVIHSPGSAPGPLGVQERAKG